MRRKKGKEGGRRWEDEGRKRRGRIEGKGICPPLKFCEHHEHKCIIIITSCYHTVTLLT
jgi:hypothetical protein